MQDLRLLTRFTHDLTTLAEQVVEIARKRVRGERVSLFLKTPGSKSMRILHCIGIDHKKLTYRYQGRDYRLTDLHGHVVHDVIA